MGPAFQLADADAQSFRNGVAVTAEKAVSILNLAESGTSSAISGTMGRNTYCVGKNFPHVSPVGGGAGEGREAVNGTVGAC